MSGREESPEPPPGTPGRTVIEQRSIDYVPLAERHGRPWHVTPVWITCSVNLAGFAIGGIGVLSGLDLVSSLLAIAVGGFFGTFFAAFHAAQGPQLGLPQMIQSRPQYGYRGAVLIFLIAIITYLGFNVASIVLLGETAALLWHVDTGVAMAISAAFAVVLAVFGYDLVHRVSRWITVVFVAVIAVLVAGLPFTLQIPVASSTGAGFSVQAFMLQASVMAVATLSWAPYVSDYTRYLPKLGVRTAFFGTYLGMSISTIVMAGLAAVTLAAFPKLDVVAAFGAAADTVFPGFGSLVLAVAFVGTIVLVTMNTYGRALTTLSAVDSFKPLRHSLKSRVATTVGFGLVSLLLAWQASNSFITAFTNLLTVLFYLLAPWTATNLVDYFFVRRGVYSVREIFNPAGIYGSWNWRGYTAYFGALLAMTPFAMTNWWSGPVAAWLGYDLAPYVGLAVAGGLYFALCRSMDLAEEARIVRLRDSDLESMNVLPVATPARDA
ncbi:purine-cytosine permease family protein [Amycolatopsis tolypomycina]|uniref:purine-cytosine permease family protein n=1 Tax=Amycolatopsis tolypomycina TaxID=208445 RepID=UPI0033B4EAF5